MDLEKPKTKARELFESTYRDKASIKIYSKEVKNGLTKTNLKELYKDVPCRLCFKNSFQSINQTVYGGNDSRYSEIVLMISPDIEIPLNSEITVTRNDKEYTYINSNSMILITHQAVILKSKETKA